MLPPTAHYTLGETLAFISARRLQLAHEPAGGVAAVYRNGVRQTPGEDYDLIGRDVTPKYDWDDVNDLVVADYWW